MKNENQESNGLVKTDMHVHIDRHVNREYIIKILKLAEGNGVRKLSLTQHNNIDQFLPNSPLMQIINEEGGIERFYTGELLPSVEMDTIVDSSCVTPNSKDHNGRTAHIQLFFGIDQVRVMYQMPWWNDRLQAKIADTDFIKFVEAGRKLGVEMPSREFCDEQKDHYIKRLYAWMKQSPKRTEQYKRILGLNESQLGNASAFFRYLHSGPGDLMYYKTDARPTLTQFIQVADTIGGKLVVNHPAHMDPNFSLREYLFVINSIPQVIKGKPNFYGIEGLYNLNTPEENAEIFDFAERYGLKLSAGSDFMLTPNGKMFVIDNVTGEKVFYDPKPGLALNAFHHKDQNSDLLAEADFMSEYAICGKVEHVKTIKAENTGALERE